MKTRADNDGVVHIEDHFVGTTPYYWVWSPVCEPWRALWSEREATHEMPTCLWCIAGEER